MFPTTMFPTKNLQFILLITDVILTYISRYQINIIYHHLLSINFTGNINISILPRVGDNIPKNFSKEKDIFLYII